MNEEIERHETQEKPIIESPTLVEKELSESLSRINELGQELADSEARFEMLEARIAADDEEVPKIPELATYKVGDYVSIVVPNQTEKEDGRVIDEANPGQLLTVATAKGEFSIGTPERIRKQGHSW